MSSADQSSPGLIPLEARRRRNRWLPKLPTWLPVILALCGVATAIGVLRVPWATPEQLASLEKRLDDKMTNLPAAIIEALRRAEKER
jgi:hypothetical protein